MSVSLRPLSFLYLPAFSSGFFVFTLALFPISGVEIRFSSIFKARLFSRNKAGLFIVYFQVNLCYWEPFV